MQTRTILLPMLDGSHIRAQVTLCDCPNVHIHFILPLDAPDDVALTFETSAMLIGGLNVVHHNGRVVAFAGINPNANAIAGESALDDLMPLLMDDREERFELGERYVDDDSISYLVTDAERNAHVAKYATNVRNDANANAHRNRMPIVGHDDDDAYLNN